MGKTITNTIFSFLCGLAGAILLGGCMVVINAGQPTKDEQSLINIQGQASQQVAQINQKIQSGQYTLQQVQDMVTQAKQKIEAGLQQINGLQIPERSKALADKTKAYLQQATQTYNSFLQMSDQNGQQLQQLTTYLKTMSQPLQNMAQQTSDLETQFFQQLKAAAKK
jgi:hypothetical protein